ncbi:uncharacterized protein LOC121873659 isoform X2 [Homarus americanus]|uniref:uncharacterized protein LOC121873659 isoform X2 n=1 Tax=Homarus americanus TaxID=6706 RepID=UPI001C47B144|nr:uncharacterized protein LOC121873659 isoform X2 [Homarus americanus]
MLLSAILPFLLVAVVPPPSSLAILLPPEGNDYPLYDFPSVQYLPHNSLVEYQDPRLDDDQRMEVATRSTYLPVPNSDSSSSSSSSSSIYPQSSSSSSSPSLTCTAEDIASILNMEDLDKVIRIVSKLEGKSVKEILLKLAIKHGLHLKAGRVGSLPPPSPDALRNFQFQGVAASPQGPLLHLRRPPNGLDTPLGGRWQPLGEDEQLFDPLAIEVPAVSPRGLPVSSLPRALLVVVDASRSEVARTPVDLGPRMALLDVLKEAKSVYALKNGPYLQNPFAIKARRMQSEMCLGLQSVGHVKASPTSAIFISVTRTRPLEEVVWDSTCLPRASELLVRSGDVIILSPR